MNAPQEKPTGSRARFNSSRTVSRKLALQALYRWQLNRCEWQDLVQEFDLTEDAPRADREFFQALVQAICPAEQELDALLTQWCDRPAKDLDPIERAVLMIGVQELRAHPETPYRVAITEAVGLARRFGATDGHKFVNAVMDRAAKELRPSGQ